MVREAGKELATYEHQFHLTNPMPGRPNAVPLEVRHRFFNSQGGALCILNDAMMFLREKQIRSQALFNLTQRQFLGGVRLWGFVPGLNYKDQRYRPQFLAQQIINEVIGGDMLATQHSGSNTTFQAEGVWEDTRRAQEKTTYGPVPTIWSYAFKDGKRRALVLFNLDTRAAQQVRAEFAGKPAGGRAKMYTLAADEIWANNEPEHAPMVEIKEGALEGFASGKALTLPAHSLTALEWTVE
jgi:hypothetical protein